MPGSKRPRDGDDSQSRLQFGPPRRLFTSEQFETSAPESVLKTVWGYDKFRGKQLQAVQQVVQGYSTIVLFPTGAGKSIVFQVAGLIRPGLCIVLCPLIALLSDQVSALEAVGIPVRMWHGKLPRASKESILQDMRAEAGPLFKFLYTTPESLVSGHELGVALGSLHEQRRLGLIAVDEAHCISQDGHDFRPLYRQLSTLQHRFAGVPIVALTATASPSCIADIVGVLGMGMGEAPSPSAGHEGHEQHQKAKGYTEVKDAFDRPNLSYGVVYKDVLNAVCPVEPLNSTSAAQASPMVHVQPYMRDVLSRVKAVVQGPPPPGLATGCVVIYDLRKQDVMSLTALLKGQGLPVACYHSDVPDEEKERVLQGWRAGTIRVVVATTAFGMGIDKADVRLVLHMTMPKSVEGWYQESGRAGRDGHPSHCLLYYSRTDKDFLQRTVSKSIVEERRRRARRQVARGRGEGAPGGGTGTGTGTGAKWMEDAGVEAMDAEQAAVDEEAVDRLLEAEGSELKPWEQSKLTSILTVATICETASCRRTGMLAYFHETLSHGRSSCKAAPVPKHRDWERMGDPLPVIPCDYCAEPAYVAAMSSCLGACLGVGTSTGMGGRAGGMGYMGGGSGSNATAMIEHLQQQGVKVRVGVLHPEEGVSSSHAHGGVSAGSAHAPVQVGKKGTGASSAPATGFVTGRQALSAQSGVGGSAKPSFPSFSGSHHVVRHGSREGMRDPDLSHLPTGWDEEEEGNGLDGDEGTYGGYGAMHLDASDYYDPDEALPAHGTAGGTGKAYTGSTRGSGASAVSGFAPASTLTGKATARPGFRPLVPQKGGTGTGTGLAAPASSTKTAALLSTVSLLSMLQGKGTAVRTQEEAGTGASRAQATCSAVASSSQSSIGGGLPNSAMAPTHVSAAYNRQTYPHAKQAASTNVPVSSNKSSSSSTQQAAKSGAQRLQQGLAAWVKRQMPGGTGRGGGHTEDDDIIDISDSEAL